MEKVIETQVLRIVNPAGEVKAVFGADDTQTSLIIGSPEKKRGLIKLLLDDEGLCGINLKSVDGYHSIALVCENDADMASISIEDADNRVRAALVLHKGTIGIDLSDKDGKTRIELYVTHAGETNVVVWNEEGKKVASLVTC